MLIGLGIDELSMNDARIPSVRQAVRGLSYAKCGELARKTLTLETPEEIGQLLKDRSWMEPEERLPAPR